MLDPRKSLIYAAFGDFILCRSFSCGTSKHKQNLRQTVQKNTKPIDKNLFYNYNIIMNTIQFEWDNNKNAINIKKHKISFEEASTVFYDDRAILFDDPEHSYEEERFLIIGTTVSSKICIVSHCYREDDEIIRIISARKATKSEQDVYEKNL